MPDLWILAGQSNMEGVGALVDVEPPHPSVRLFAHGDSWRLAEEPLHWLDEANDPVHWGDVAEADRPAHIANMRATRDYGAGCGLPFAKAVVEATGRAVDLLPAAHGGTSMQQWSPELKHLGGRSLYGALLRRYRLLMETSPESELKGILWYQGESDCDAMASEVYSKRMIELVAELRNDLGSPNLPFLMVQLGCVSFPPPVPPEKEYWTAVRELQRNLSHQVPDLQVVPAIDLSLDDLIHISTPGLKRLGKRLANVALREVYGQDAPRPITLDSVTVQGQNRIKVRLSGFSCKLQVPDPGGRIPGFGLVSTSGVYNPAAFYKAEIDPAATDQITLYAVEPLTPSQQLVYGYGLCPFCQLTDEADMAVPAFGPISLG